MIIALLVSVQIISQFYLKILLKLFAMPIQFLMIIEICPK